MRTQYKISQLAFQLVCVHPFAQLSRDLLDGLVISKIGMRQVKSRIVVARQTGKRNPLIGQTNADKVASINTFVRETEDADLLLSMSAINCARKLLVVTDQSMPYWRACL